MEEERLLTRGGTSNTEYSPIKPSRHPYTKSGLTAGATEFIVYNIINRQNISVPTSGLKFQQAKYS
jgi:hypothetical protein